MPMGVIARCKVEDTRATSVGATMSLVAPSRGRSHSHRRLAGPRGSPTCFISRGAGRKKSVMAPTTCSEERGRRARDAQHALCSGKGQAAATLPTVPSHTALATPPGPDLGQPDEMATMQKSSLEKEETVEIEQNSAPQS